MDMTSTKRDAILYRLSLSNGFATVLMVFFTIMTLASAATAAVTSNLAFLGPFLIGLFGLLASVFIASTCFDAKRNL